MAKALLQYLNRDAALLKFPCQHGAGRKWEAIFKDAMMTAAAIDRLVHHSVIIELNIPSYRVEHAKKNQQAESQGAGE